MDRPPFDLFDECGLLFSSGAYDPARRIFLSLEEQIDARIRFQQEFDTDLIFDAPVIGKSEVGFRARLSPEAAESFELKQAVFPLTACLWMPWSPHLVARPGRTPREGPRCRVPHRVGERSSPPLVPGDGKRQSLRLRASHA